MFPWKAGAIRKLYNEVSSYARNICKYSLSYVRNISFSVAVLLLFRNGIPFTLGTFISERLFGPWNSLHDDIVNAPIARYLQAAAGRCIVFHIPFTPSTPMYLQFTFSMVQGAQQCHCI